jgi:hypothetical protein
MAAASMAIISAMLAAALAIADSADDANQLRAAIEPRLPVRDLSPECMRVTKLS